MSPSQSGLHRETETPADELRAAAKRIRDLAAAATPGPWLNLDNGDRIIRDPDATAAEDDSDPCGEGPPIEYVVDEPLSYPWNGDHIVLWDPPKALLVAAWLDAEADRYDDLDPQFQFFVAGDAGGELDPAISLARAINSSTPSPTEVQHGA